MANPITVNSITFQNLDYYAAISHDYIFGNIGDEITCVINFDIPSGLNAGEKLIFKNNIVTETGTDLQPALEDTTPDYTVDPFLFVDEISGETRLFTGTAVGALDVSSTGKSFLTGSATLANVSGDNYTITHVFKLPTIVRFTDVTNNEYSRDLTGNALGQRYIFLIQTQQEFSPSIITSTAGTDPLNDIADDFFKFGSVGAFDRLGQSAYYSLNGDITGDINYAVNSAFSCKLSSTNGNFTATTKLKIFIQDVKSLDSTNGSLTLTDNLNIEVLNFVADGSSNNGTNILSATASVDGTPTDLNLSFVIKKEEYITQYAIWVAVSNDNSNINHNNILLQINDAALLVEADDSVISLEEPVGAGIGDNFAFYQTNQTEVLQAYNGLNAFIEDRVISKWLIKNSDNSNTTITSFTIKIDNQEADKQIGVPPIETIFNAESLIISAENIPYTTDRNFTLPDGDEFKDVDVSKSTVSTTDTYTFTYAFQVWKDWNLYSFLRFKVVVSGIQTILGNDISFTKEFWSGRFDIGGYDISENAYSEPVIVIKERNLADAESVFFDGDGIIDNSSKIGGILKDNNTYVQFVFEETNLGDLEKDLADFFGYIGINSISENQAEYYQAINAIEWDSNAPFLPVSGHGSNTAKITKINTTEVMIEVLLDKDKLFNLFPSVTQFELSARMNAIADFGDFTAQFMDNSDALFMDSTTANFLNK